MAGSLILEASRDVNKSDNLKTIYLFITEYIIHTDTAPIEALVVSKSVDRDRVVKCVALKMTAAMYSKRRYHVHSHSFQSRTNPDHVMFFMRRLM